MNSRCFSKGVHIIFAQLKFVQHFSILFLSTFAALMLDHPAKNYANSALGCHAVSASSGFAALFLGTAEEALASTKLQTISVPHL